MAGFKTFLCISVHFQIGVCLLKVFYKADFGKFFVPKLSLKVENRARRNLKGMTAFQIFWGGGGVGASKLKIFKEFYFFIVDGACFGGLFDFWG